MATQGKKYFSIRNTLKVVPDANYYLILGEKGNGKSYSVKEYLLEECYKNKKRFAYFRRFADDIKPDKIKAWLQDMVCDNNGRQRIKEITNGEWDDIKVDKTDIYLCRHEVVTKRKRVDFDEEGKAIYDLVDEIEIKLGPQIGKAFWVSRRGYDSIASLAFVGYKFGIVEEFIGQVTNEDDDVPDMLIKMVSTIFRDNDAKIFLLGNRISRFNPFFRKWKLEGALNQKAGTIDVYNFEEVDEVSQRKYTTKIAVESCASAGTSSSMFFGAVKKSIQGDSYDVKDSSNVFRESLKDYESIYEILFTFSGISYIGKLLVNSKSGALIFHVSPFTSLYKKVRRVITNEFSSSPFTSSSFMNQIKAEVKIQELISMNKIAFSDALTAKEFPELLKKVHKNC